ncbi:hypothetical protein N177_2969 [Lutibaculum baratangense AMV1]|uniref:Uncharacterized protein n=1 Tax=Lutibaculum baratangense AMV1 TaxID=631454 RepID=V4REB8_9HYPH|nr:hypothetical protein N177_2969 [Lutibaculum baratangense AMV1]
MGKTRESAAGKAPDVHRAKSVSGGLELGNWRMANPHHARPSPGCQLCCWRRDCASCGKNAIPNLQLRLKADARLRVRRLLRPRARGGA